MVFVLQDHKTTPQTYDHLRGSTNKRYIDNVNKLKQVLQNHNVSFEYNEDLVTKVVLPGAVTKFKKSVGQIIDKTKNCTLSLKF